MNPKRFSGLSDEKFIGEKDKKAGFEVVEASGIDLADEAPRQNRFLPAYIIENASINQKPEYSYIFYFKTQKKGLTLSASLASQEKRV